jgi:hypothetical protein
MSSSVAPLFPKTSVFIPAYWATARSETLTQEEADTRYLRFPVGQGTESIPNLIVSGTSTLGITTASAPAVLDNSTRVPTTDWVNTAISASAGATISITDTNTAGTFYPTFVSGSGAGQTLRADINTTPLTYNPNTGMLTTTQFTTTGSYGSAQKFYKDTSDTYPLQIITSVSTYYDKSIKVITPVGFADQSNTLTTTASSNDTYLIGQLQLTSGDDTTTAPRAVLQGSIEGGYGHPTYPDITNSLDLGGGNGATITINNGNSAYDLPENNIIMTYNSSYASNLIKLNVGFPYVGANEGSFLTLGYDNFTLHTNGYPVFTILNSGNQLNMRRIINFGTGPASSTTTGILEKSTINATTTGSTTLTANANAFTTIINTPSASGRIFVLPAPTSATIGYWYAFCNKSTANIITINSSAGVAQITIPAGTAGGAGGYGAVAVDSAGTAYCRVG